MISKIFFDTNAIMDFLGERKGALEIGKIISIAENRAWTIYISPVSIATTFYLLTKTLGKETALQKIKLFKQISCVSEINDEVVNKAINSDFSDFEDALQYFSALASGCDVIITKNEKDFRKAEIPVLNATDFLADLDNFLQ